MIEFRLKNNKKISNIITNFGSYIPELTLRFPYNQWYFHMKVSIMLHSKFVYIKITHFALQITINIDTHT